MAKKSFFERLVGVTEEIRKNQSEESPLPKKISTDLPRVETKRKPAQKESKSEITAPEPAAEEWPSDEEGQLTIDVYQTDTDIVIKSTIAGVKSDDIDISVTENMITIKGKRTKDEKVNPENYYYQELYWGPFSRSVILPVDVDTDKIRAALKDGILTIRLPKTERLKTKTIKVREIE